MPPEVLAARPITVLELKEAQAVLAKHFRKVASAPDPHDRRILLHDVYRGEATRDAAHSILIHAQNGPELIRDALRAAGLLSKKSTYVSFENPYHAICSYLQSGTGRTVWDAQVSNHLSWIYNKHGSLRQFLEMNGFGPEVFQKPNAMRAGGPKVLSDEILGQVRAAALNQKAPNHAPGWVMPKRKKPVIGFDDARNKVESGARRIKGWITADALRVEFPELMAIVEKEYRDSAYLEKWVAGINFFHDRKKP